MAVTETRTVSYGSRVKNSLGGIGTGIIMFLIGTCLLWWNEGRAVKTAKMLEEAQGVAVHVDDVSKLDPSLTGQLIHATAESKTTDQLSDEQFGYSVAAVKLDRKVEYFQFVENSETETKDKLGGSQEVKTTYTCEKSWTGSPVNSSDFHGENARLYQNTTLMQFENKYEVAKNVTFGGYRLSPDLISGISGSVPAELNIEDSRLIEWNTTIARTVGDPAARAAAEAAAKAAAEVAEVKDTTATDSAATAASAINDNRYEYVHVAGNVVYFGKNPSNPQIGDVRVTITQVNPGLVSVLAQVDGDTFVPFTAKNGKTLSTISMGRKTMEQMFEQQKSANNMWLWIWRVVGTLLVCLGLKGIFDILSTILKVIPFLANIVNWGVGFVCNVIGIVWSLLIIAIAWIFYRPVLGISIIVAVVAILGFFAYRGGKLDKFIPKKEQAPAPEA